MPSLPVTETTRGRRLANRVSHDLATIHAILDEGLVCHIGAVVRGRPWVQPTLHWRIGEELFIHGHAGNGLYAALVEGAEACATVTLLDGLVLARSAFHHSVNFRSVVVFGTVRAVTDPAEKNTALEAMMDKLAPGRWPDVRAPSPSELKATAVLALPITEASAKVRQGMPKDDAEDMAVPVWAGVVPLSLTRGEPVEDCTPTA
ncbi:MAG: pyridoxamine 5'-phosphate oxidase family protein [Rhodospirillaceae bacterium]